ncbi:MAG TPA: DUF1566 domain-containing protein [Desulfobacterales bacterium]|nr:DUF1566 domain-containing protein [Desulfobacterales bacterium]
MWLLFCLVLVGSAAVSRGAVYIDNGDGTVTDNQQGVMWQQTDDGKERTWQEAGKYCKNLDLAGHKDWRLPEISLLTGLLEPANSPTVDPALRVKPSYYWSATEGANPNTAKYVNFFYGNSYAYSKDNSYYVLCVRNAVPQKVNNLAVSISDQIAPAAPYEVKFKAKITGGTAPYFIEWDFGDGETAGILEPRHVFASLGTYKVLLTVSDNDGAVSSAAAEIVLPPPAAGTGAKAAAVVQPPPAASSGNKAVGNGVFPAGESVNKTLLSRKTQGTAKVNSPETANTGAVEEESAASSEVKNGQRKDGSEAAAAGEGLVVKPESQPDNRVLAPLLEISTGGQTGGISNSLGHGLLAYAMVNALHGDADWNKDNVIMAHELRAYMSAAVANISMGAVKAKTAMSGDDFGICSAAGTTYLLAVGLDKYHDDFQSQPFVLDDIPALQKAVAGRCAITKSMVLTGKHANRAEFLHAMRRIGSLMKPADRVIFYFAGVGKPQDGRLNLFFYDTIKGMSAFTGIFYGDITSFLRQRPGSGVTAILELGDRKQETGG